MDFRRVIWSDPLLIHFFGYTVNRFSLVLTMASTKFVRQIEVMRISSVVSLATVILLVLLVRMYRSSAAPSVWRMLMTIVFVVGSVMAAFQDYDSIWRMVIALFPVLILGSVHLGKTATTIGLLGCIAGSLATGLANGEVHIVQGTSAAARVILAHADATIPILKGMLLFFISLTTVILAIANAITNFPLVFLQGIITSA